jgi:Zn-dependent membrane protease YugP
MGWYHYLGLTIIVLTDLAWTAILLAPGLAGVYFARRRLAMATAIGTSETRFAGREVVERSLDDEGVSGMSIETAEASPTDFFDCSGRSIRLSRAVAEGRTVYAAAVAARQAAHAVRLAEGDPLELLPNILFFAIRLGTVAGWLTMAAGVVLCSWAPIQTGATLFSVAVLGPLPLLAMMERNATRMAARSLRAAGFPRETDEVVAALGWAILANAAVGGPRRVRPGPLISAS